MNRVAASTALRSVADASEMPKQDLLVTSSVVLHPSSFLFLVVMPGATSSFLLLIANLLLVRPGAPLVASLLLVAMPFVTSSDGLHLVASATPWRPFSSIAVKPKDAKTKDTSKQI